MYNNTSIEGQLDLEIDEIDSAYTKQNNITHHSIMIEADAIIERNFDDGSRSIVLNEREIAILSLAAIQSLPPIVYAHTSSLLD